VNRENWIALGLVTIVVGLMFAIFSNSPVYAQNYTAKGSLDNSKNYAANKSPEVSVSGHFEAGQRFFFNFTKGRFWGVKYDVENGGLEPEDSNWAPDSAIPAHKEAWFDIFTPSGDRISVDVFVLGGTDLFAVVWANQSVAFTPLDGGNKSLFNVGVEGMVGLTGNYTVTATAIINPIYKSADEIYFMNTDPPLMMNLWSIESVESKPYLVPFASVGTVLTVSGVVSSVWMGRSKKGSSRHLKKAGPQK
jgi:hypothetical protein